MKVKLLLALTLVTGSGARAGSPVMATLGLTAAPIGHHELCRRLPGECRQLTPDTRPVLLNRDVWQLLYEVNEDANRTIVQRSDPDLRGVAEYWSYPDERGGDCEDIVLAKRKRLLDAGLPAGSLLITVVRRPDGEGHAVLTVRTSAGDFILDNLESRILRWRDTPYRFLKRQSERNSGVWVAIGTEHAPAVASVR